MAHDDDPAPLRPHGRVAAALAATAAVPLLSLRSGGADGDGVWLYAATTAAASAFLTLPWQLTVLGVTALGWVALVLTDPVLAPLALALRVAVVSVVAAAGFVSVERAAALRRARDDAAQESHQRAALLQRLAATTRDVDALDPERTLPAVVDAVELLGFDGVALCRYDEATSSYALVHARGLPPAFTRQRTWSLAGIPGLLSGGKTVVVRDYPTHPQADPALVAAGVATVVATPVWPRGPHAAALLATAAHDVAPEDVEALELLAVQARVAVDTARRFAENLRAVQRLSELDRLKNDFLATVSHELRTPLTVIRGVGSTLAARWDALPDRKRRELVAQVEANAAHLERIIVALLDFSSLALVERGRSEAFALGPVLERLATRMRPLFADHRLRVQIGDDVAVIGDPALLDRAVEQLLSNAVQHTPAGTTVTLRAAREDDDVVVEVADDGPGIADDDQRYLGERFFRVSDPDHRGSEGLGLGLALVGEILRLHDSRLQVESTPGRGARFSFRLPHAALPVAPPTKRARSRR